MASDSFLLAVERTKGQLPAVLRGYQQEGMSVRKMSRQLLVDHNIDVSNVALRRWLAWAEEAVA